VPGSVCYYHAGEPHQMLQVAPDSLDIHVDIPQEFFQRFSLDDRQMDRIIKGSPEIKLLMVRIWRELLINDQAAMLTVQMELIRLLSDPPKAFKPNGVPPQMRLVANFLEEHWDRQITLAELSAIAGLHPVTICKYFSSYFGCTLGEHLRNLKISYALQLLPSDLSLTEVAYCCGFFDQSHFTRTFKQLTGFLPLQFRNGKIG
jgi:AraC family transcriptional regulator